LTRFPALRTLARRPVVSDLLVTLGGRWAQMLIALAGNVISARVLGPDDFGRFGLVMAVVTIGGTLADAGLTYTAVKFIAQYRTGDPARAHAVARAYLGLRLGSGALVAVAGVIGAAPLAGGLLGYPALTPYMQLAFCTLFSLSVSSYPGTVLVALARFGRLGVAGVINAAITLAGILALLLAGRLDLGTLIAWNVILPVVSTLPTWGFLPAAWRPWHRPPHAATGEQRGVVRELTGFSRWMMLSTLGSIIAGQGDLLLLGRFATPATVGVYSVALTLALRLDTLNQSLTTVLVPRASRLSGPGALRGYTRRVLRGSLLLAGGLAGAALVAQPLIALVYGERYAASAGLFGALIIVVLFDLITSSLFLVAFPLNKPRVLAVADWLRVGVLGVAGMLLIPALAGLGAVVARLLARVVGAGYTFWALRRALQAAPDEPEPDSTAATRWAS
jgi:O-antigen/teichoic acid export membrane protein